MWWYNICATNTIIEYGPQDTIYARAAAVVLPFLCAKTGAAAASAAATWRWQDFLMNISRVG